MTWLMGVVVIVMVLGFVGTMMIGQSKSNKEANSGYYANAEKKWNNLSGIYILSMIAVVIIIFAVLLK
ncbi:hypothetical protein [Paenibacillus sp. R14(2021)]|uniref:hypothetical protein n=1 Tax=Paenibacillus sp. R14(2021) TaxID=2859228 RepID=UPI001C614B81|nr:hypothetical protein [Paenibacillus sp. R14(2021)]